METAAPVTYKYHPIMVFVLGVHILLRDTCQWLRHLSTITQSIILFI